MCLSVHGGGGGISDVTSCLAAWSMFLPGGSVQEEGSSPGGLCRETPRNQKAGGTHPTKNFHRMLLHCTFFAMRWTLHCCKYQTLVSKLHNGQLWSCLIKKLGFPCCAMNILSKIPAAVRLLPSVKYFLIVFSEAWK